MATVLIVETDPGTIHLLPRILFDDLRDVVVDVCTSVSELKHNRKLSTYDAIAINPILLQDSQLHQNKAYRYSIAPLVVTASLEECELATTYLQQEAFDVIVKPLVPPGGRPDGPSRAMAKQITSITGIERTGSGQVP